MTATVLVLSFFLFGISAVRTRPLSAPEIVKVAAYFGSVKIDELEADLKGGMLGFTPAHVKALGGAQLQPSGNVARTKSIRERSLSLRPLLSSVTALGATRPLWNGHIQQRHGQL